MTGPSSDRERSHYRRASWREQLAEMWADFLANRRLQLALAAILFVLVTLRVLTPANVELSALEPGQCIFVRTSAANALVGERPIGDPDEIRAILRSQGAEVASCDLSHGHEVADAGDLPDAPGTPYPGEATLIERQAPACAAAFERYVGRPAEESRYGYLVVVPDEGAWNEGSRAWACLVERDDGHFMDHRAAGSGE